MIKAGVIGYPVAQSLSPKLHGYWLKKYKIDGEYKAYEVKPEELENFIRDMPKNGFAGCNVTIPHKEAVFDMLGQNHVDDMAYNIGAVNTVIVRNGKCYGSNTDVFGFIKNIESHLKHKNKAVVLGAGGAAKAVWKALLDMNFSQVITVNRNQHRATLSQKFGDHFHARLWEDRSSPHILEDADLLVNTTSLGMAGQEPLDINLGALPIRALVTDIVYKPLITPLLAQAKARGNPIVDGLGMLLHQAVPGFEAWFGVKPEVTAELREHILAT